MYEWVVWNPSKGAYVKLSSMLYSRGQIKKKLRYKSSAVDYSGGVCYVEAMVVSTQRKAKEEEKNAEQTQKT